MHETATKRRIDCAKEIVDNAGEDPKRQAPKDAYILTQIGNFVNSITIPNSSMAGENATNGDN